MRKLARVTAIAILAIAAIPGVAQAAFISSWSLTADANDSADSNSGTPTDVTFTGSDAVFNGTSSKISVPYTANLSPGSADVTAKVEINTTFMPGTDGFDFDLLRSAKGNPQYKIELYPRSGKAQAQCIFHGSVANTTLHKGPSLNDRRLAHDRLHEDVEPGQLDSGRQGGGHAGHHHRRDHTQVEDAVLDRLQADRDGVLDLCVIAPMVMARVPTTLPSTVKLTWLDVFVQTIVCQAPSFKLGPLCRVVFATDPWKMH